MHLMMGAFAGRRWWKRKSLHHEVLSFCLGIHSVCSETLSAREGRHERKIPKENESVLTSDSEWPHDCIQSPIRLQYGTVQYSKRLKLIEENFDVVQCVFSLPKPAGTSARRKNAGLVNIRCQKKKQM